LQISYTFSSSLKIVAIRFPKRRLTPHIQVAKFQMTAFFIVTAVKAPKFYKGSKQLNANQTSKQSKATKQASNAMQAMKQVGKQGKQESKQHNERLASK
jgi:hypothetical protein